MKNTTRMMLSINQNIDSVSLHPYLGQLFRVNETNELKDTHKHTLKHTKQTTGLFGG